jgi:hypothetical protein
VTLFSDGIAIAEYPCITGGSVKDPRQYGGLTPAIEWEMIEMIEVRTLRGRKPFAMARLVPTDPDYAKRHYPNRTFHRLEIDPFMTHEAGRSTGCPSILPSHWAQARQALNTAWQANGGSLVWQVVEKEDARLSEMFDTLALMAAFAPCQEVG